MALAADAERAGSGGGSSWLLLERCGRLQVLPGVPSRGGGLYCTDVLWQHPHFVPGEPGHLQRQRRLLGAMQWHPNLLPRSGRQLHSELSKDWQAVTIRWHGLPRRFERAERQHPGDRVSPRLFLAADAPRSTAVPGSRPRRHGDRRSGSGGSRRSWSGSRAPCAHHGIPD